MRYFTWDNAGMPVAVAGQRLTFEIVARVAGTTVGVLAVEDATVAQGVATHGARLGIEEISQAQYDELRAKKKSHPRGRGLRPNSDPWAERERSRNQSPPAAAAAENAETAETQKLRNAEGAMRGKGGAVTVDAATREQENAEGAAAMPSVDDLFAAGRIAVDAEKGEVKAEAAAAKRGNAETQKRAKRPKAAKPE